MDTFNRQRISKPHMLKGPDGKVYYVRLLEDFCRERNQQFPREHLSARQLRKLSRGSIEQYKGWTNAKRNG